MEYLKMEILFTVNNLERFKIYNKNLNSKHKILNSSNWLI